MSVASHLGIELAEYDHRIRTFIPAYEEMLGAAADAVDTGARTIVELGVGTGALAARCLKRVPKASVVGIDADSGILALAGRRLGRRAKLLTGNFVRASLPPADAVVASFALHHVRTRDAKARLYQRVGVALRPGGLFISADCHPAADRARAASQRDAWKTHLCASYDAVEAEALLRAWGREDVYVPLDEELALLKRAGFGVDVAWRRGAFAVIVAINRRRTAGEARRRRQGS
jgi:SAM-dependent methyltransferase